jgi:hypothetical protein
MLSWAVAKLGIDLQRRQQDQQGSRDRVAGKQHDKRGRRRVRDIGEQDRRMDLPEHAVSAPFDAPV